MICSRCIYDDEFPGVKFDDQGVCNYCHQIEEVRNQYIPTIEQGQANLEALIAKVKKKSQRRRFDCIVGVSGGTDSSFLLMKCIDWGLRPLAVHFDNTWNASVASENIYTITSKLAVPLETYVLDCMESDDLKRSFLLARVREFDADTDIAYVQILRTYAAKHKVKFIFEGHSFSAEGFTPVSANYLDGKYVEDIHKRYGSIKLKAFPNMDMRQFLKWIIFYRQKFVRPLWYLPYNKDEAREELSVRLGWKYYGGHHLENFSSRFAHSVWLPNKFKIDYRILSLSASVREGKVSRMDAMNELAAGNPVDSSFTEYVFDRLGLTSAQFEVLLKAPSQTPDDFKTYKLFFRRFRFVFYLFALMKLVPMSFYLKYCKAQA